MSKEKLTWLINSQLEHYQAVGYDEATRCELTVRDILRVIEEKSIELSLESVAN